MPTIPLTDKPAGYYGTPRDQTIALLRRPLGRVLDVGCGEAASHAALRAAGATAITGIEIVEPAAEIAKGRYDEVLVGDAARCAAELEGPFDTILCYDVLEHLVAPTDVLDRARELLAPGGQLHVSLPNARYFSLAADLVFRGTFGYRESGVQDATHLRFFTRRDALELLSRTGFHVDDVTPSHGPRVGRLLRATRGLGTEFVVTQWAFLARPA